MNSNIVDDKEFIDDLQRLGGSVLITLDEIRRIRRKYGGILRDTYTDLLYFILQSSLPLNFLVSEIEKVERDVRYKSGLR